MVVALGYCLKGGPILQALCDLGYSAMDIITTVFRVVRNYDMHEFLKLEFIKVIYLSQANAISSACECGLASSCNCQLKIKLQIASTDVIYLILISAARIRILHNRQDVI